MIKYIVYASSDSYSPLLAASMVSLMTNNPDTRLTFLIFDNGISVTNKERIAQLANKWHYKCYFIEMRDFSLIYDKKLEVHELDLTTYARLFLGEILPVDIDKVLYIDCDTIINGNISELLELDIDNVGMAGVEDTINDIEKNNINLSLSTSYYNAGVLLLNLKYWRENKLFAKFKKCIEDYNGKVPYLDQGILNITVEDRMTLPLKYNVQSPIYAFKNYKKLMRYFGLSHFYSSEEYMSSKSSPIIIHFTSFFLGRPWTGYCHHPLEKIFFQYFNKTGFSLSELKQRIRLSSKVKDWAFLHLQSIYIYIKQSHEKINNTNI